MVFEIAPERRSASFRNARSASPESPRLDNFNIEVSLPVLVGAEHRTGVEEAVQRCLIRNTLLHPPKSRLTSKTARWLQRLKGCVEARRSDRAAVSVSIEKGIGHESEQSMPRNAPRRGKPTMGPLDLEVNAKFRRVIGDVCRVGPTHHICAFLNATPSQ
jgi:hypothetical protein